MRSGCIEYIITRPNKTCTSIKDIFILDVKKVLRKSLSTSNKVIMKIDEIPKYTNRNKLISCPCITASGRIKDVINNIKVIVKETINAILYTNANLLFSIESPN